MEVNIRSKRSSQNNSGNGNGDDRNDPFRRGRLLPLHEARIIAAAQPWKLVSKVADYKGARDGYPEQYPGRRPASSFLYLKRGNREPMVHIMSFENIQDPYSANVFIPGTGFVRLDKILEDMGAPQMRDMYLTVGYGSNPCPGQIKAKLEQGRVLGVEGVQDVMIVIRGSLKGYDPVVASFIEAGYPFAGLLQEERTKDTRSEVWATLLSRSALKSINLAEKMVDPYDPSKSDPNADYALAKGYPFEIDGFDFAIEAAAYTGAENIYTPRVQFSTDYFSKTPIAFDTIPASGRAFPQTDVVGVFQLILENMTAQDSRFEIDRLLKDRGISLPEMVRLTDIYFDMSMDNVPERIKILALMRWMNERWRIIKDGKRPEADMELTSAIKDHMRSPENSYELNMLKNKLKEGEALGKRIVFSREEADAPEDVKFGNVLPL
jgi:hypothetical protein